MMHDGLDERPATRIKRLARDEEHQRWLTVVASSMSGTVRPVDPGAVLALLLILVAVLAASGLTE